MSRYVSVNVDVDLEDIDTDDLVNELERRNKREKKIVPVKFDTPELMLKYIKAVLGLQDWHKKERVLQEIENLY